MAGLPYQPHTDRRWAEHPAPADEACYNNEVNNRIVAQPIFQDPLLAGPANNGGPTGTMALQPGSPAVNAGNPARCPGRDQRGYTRQGVCDSGAYELNGLPFAPFNFLYLPGILFQAAR